jgi:hypothetical protein
MPWGKARCKNGIDTYILWEVVLDMKNIVTIIENSETALAKVTELLFEHGLQVERSFDLRITQKVDINCSCPRHGTTLCDCQIIVLLIYGSKKGPETVVAHSQDGRTHFSLVSQPDNSESSDLVNIFREMKLVDSASS